MPILLKALFTHSFTDIIEQPVSINTTLNSTVTFTCRASADELTFRVNGETYTDEDVMNKGFNGSTQNDSIGTRSGKLQAIAYNYNNNTNIKCRASNDNPATVVFSNTAVLLIQG